MQVDGPTCGKSTGARTGILCRPRFLKVLQGPRLLFSHRMHLHLSAVMTVFGGPKKGGKAFLKRLLAELQQSHLVLASDVVHSGI